MLNDIEKLRRKVYQHMDMAANAERIGDKVGEALQLKKASVLRKKILLRWTR